MVTGAFSVYMHRYKQADIKKKLAGVAFRDVSFIYRTSRLAEVVNRHLSFMLSGKQLKGMGARNVTPSIGTPIHNLHSQIGNTGLRCISLVHRHRRTKGGDKTSTPSNHIPESGIRFCVFKSKGVVIRHPIKPTP